MSRTRYIPFDKKALYFYNLVAKSGYKVEIKGVRKNIVPVDSTSLEMRKISIENLYVDAVQFMLDFHDEPSYEHKPTNKITYERIIDNSILMEKFQALIDKYGNLSILQHIFDQDTTDKMIASIYKKLGSKVPKEFEHCEQVSGIASLPPGLMINTVCEGEDVEIWISLLNFIYKGRFKRMLKAGLDSASKISQELKNPDSEFTKAIEKSEILKELSEEVCERVKEFTGEEIQRPRHRLKRFDCFTLMSQLSVDINPKNDNFFIKHTSLGSALLLFCFNYDFPDKSSCKQCNKSFIDKTTKRKNKTGGRMFCSDKCKVQNWRDKAEAYKEKRADDDRSELQSIANQAIEEAE